MAITSLGAAALSAGASFLGNVGGSVSGGLFSANQAKKNRAFQERMYKQSVADAERFWNMENEYNLPSAVYQRELEGLKANNLNPYLMYSNGAPTGNLADQPKTPTPPAGAQGQVGSFNTAIDLPNLALIQAQVENVRSDSELKTAQALTEAERTIREREEGKKAGSEAFFNMASWRERLESIHRKNELDKSMTALNEELAKTEPEKRQQIISERKLIDKQFEYVDQQILDLENQIMNRNRITTAQINKMQQEVNVMIEKAAHEMALMDAQAREYAANAFILEIQGALKSLPEWQVSELLKLEGEAKKAFYEGDEQNIKAVMARYMWDTMPKYDSSSYSYRKWLKNYVEPTTKAIGNVFGGSGAAAIGLLK